MAAIFNTIRGKVVGKVIEIGVDNIVPNPHQPRRCFYKEELVELAGSIRTNGILQPLSVRRLRDGTVELISGERRLRAAKMAGLEVVPCIQVDTSERDSAVLALIENIQRQDLDYFEEASAIERLIDFYGMTQEDAAVKLGKAQSTIANKLRLLKLSDLEKKLLCEYQLTERHARALLKLKDENKRLEIIEKIHKDKLNVVQSEALIEQCLANEKPKRAKHLLLINDVRLFVNTINRAIESMKAAGINAESHKVQNDGYIEYVVRIPTKNNNS